MSTVGNFAHTSEDVISGDVEWVRGGGSKKICYALPQNRKVRVRFVTDPATMATDHGWASYREVNAFNGLIGGDEMPNGLKEFPVDDYEIVVDPEDGRRKKRRKKDLLMERVRPSKWDIEDGRNFPSARDRVVCNVVFEGGELEKKEQYNPPVGALILLKMSASAYRDLKQAFDTYRDVDPSFTPVGVPWDLLIEGRGATARLLVTRVKGEPPLDSLPDPIDTVAWVNDLRGAAEKYIAGLDGTFVEDEAEESEEASYEQEIAEEYEANRLTSSDWSEVSNATIKTRLRNEAKVDVPARITREELIELAIKHNLAA